MGNQPLQHTPSAAAPDVLSGTGRSGLTGPPTKPISGQRKKDSVDAHIPNIIIYGETGAGKSSIVNLIAGQELAHNSNDALGRTSQHRRYTIELNRTSYVLWDTGGLEEGIKNTVFARVAESNLRLLLQELANTGGIHLLVYCIRADRLRNAHKRNYDLFYATVCRKKVPVALVVTGLEHQRGGMETWWNENEEVLCQSGMRFDAHACVTALDVEDRVIRERRSESQRRLRELVVACSRSPAWKIDPPFKSRVLSLSRAALHRAMVAGRTKKGTTIVRRVIVCDMAEDNPIEFSPGITAVWERFKARIGDGEYEFSRMSKHSLQTLTTRTLGEVRRVDAGLLVFYTSTLLNARIPPAEIGMLEMLCDAVDGRVCPIIVVVRGCNDEVFRACWADVALHHSNIQAHFVSLPSAADGGSGMQTKLGEMIQRLCIGHVKSPEDTRLAGNSRRPWWKRLLQSAYTVALTAATVNPRKWLHRPITCSGKVKCATGRRACRDRGSTYS